jgi:hypothetical protein
MRMQSGTTRLIALIATSLGAASGCSDITAGRRGAPSGAPRVERVMIQDNSGARAQAADLLDKDPAPSCSDINPCVNQFLILQQTPDLTCQPTGVCIDPLAVPSTGVPIISTGNEIRVVFNKLLENVETVGDYVNGVPSGYTLNPGLIEFIGPTVVDPVSGKTVDPNLFWDTSGVFDFTSDIILVPFGPALVIDATLAPNADYTIRLHSSMLTAVNGQSIVDKQGNPVPDPYDITFHTESITTTATYPDLTGATATISQNEVLQFATWEQLDIRTATVTGTAPAGVDLTHVEVYYDQGNMPVAKACAKALNTQQVDIVLTDGATPKAPINWPAGDYTLTLNAKDIAGVAFTQTFKFTVAAADAAKATNTIASHVTPEQCK